MKKHKMGALKIISVFRRIYIVMLLPYTIMLLYFMFIGFGREQYEHHIVRLVPIASTFNFITISWWKNSLINVLGNIVMFIPYGFLGWIFPTCRNFKSLIFSFLSVLIIVEALQYFTRLGVFDVDDFLLNTLGVSIGFRIWRRLESDSSDISR
ncbi:VanZ family protein [Bergeyella zoohelcum]|uniref:VanZ family protein n=1 Tax=Bergeyella zoohelcum TaxID=1015 RepID=UPI003736B42E